MLTPQPPLATERTQAAARSLTFACARVVNDGLEVSVFGVLRGIRDVMSSANLSDSEKVTAALVLLDKGQSEGFDQLKDDLAATARNASWHDILEARSLKLQNRLSSVLRALNFMPNTGATELQTAIDHFKADGDLSVSHAPMAFFDAEQKAALIRTDGAFRVSLYKVFLFQAVTTAIKSGHLNVEPSYKYRPMDAYLIDKQPGESHLDRDSPAPSVPEHGCPARSTRSQPER